MAGERQGEQLVYDYLKKELGDPMEEAAKRMLNIFGKGGKIDWLGVAGKYPANTKFYAKSGVTGDWIEVRYAFGKSGGRSDDPGIKLPESRIEFSFDGISGRYAAVIPDGPPIFSVPGITPGAETPAVEGSIESWAWTNKYFQAQRQVAEAQATEIKPTKAAATLPIEELALPAAGIGLAWWLSKGW